MPRQVSEKVGEIHRVRTVKTGWDKFVEGLQMIGGVLVILMIIGLIVG